MKIQHVAMYMSLFLLLCGCAIKGDRDKRAVERLLGITLPADSSGLLYEKRLATDEFMRPYTVYIRAEMSPDSYHTLVRSLKLLLLDDERPADMTLDYRFLLPGHVKRGSQAPESGPGSASLDLDLTAAGPNWNSSYRGYVVSTYSAGVAYIKVYEQEELKVP